MEGLKEFLLGVPEEVLIIIGAVLIVVFLLKSIINILKLSVLVVGLMLVAYAVDPTILDRIPALPTFGGLGYYVSNSADLVSSALERLKGN